MSCDLNIFAKNMSNVNLFFLIYTILLLLFIWILRLAERAVQETKVLFFLLQNHFIREKDIRLNYIY